MNKYAVTLHKSRTWLGREEFSFHTCNMNFCPSQISRLYHADNVLANWQMYGLSLYNAPFLQYTSGIDCWLLVVRNLTRPRSGSLKCLDNVQGLLVSDLTKDNVLAIQPGSDDSGDEELGAVAIGTPLAAEYVGQA